MGLCLSFHTQLQFDGSTATLLFLFQFGHITACCRLSYFGHTIYLMRYSCIAAISKPNFRIQETLNLSTFTHSTYTYTYNEIPPFLALFGTSFTHWYFLAHVGPFWARKMLIKLCFLWFSSTLSNV